MNEEIRKVENYEIINSMHIGGKEIVIGIDMNNAEGLYYMVADCERNELFERYDNALVSDSYIDIAEIYSDRLKEQIEKLRDQSIDGFDFIFVDAAKSHYKRFLEAALTVAADGALIISDNILMRGMTASDEFDTFRKHKTNIRKMREYVEFICTRSDLDTSLMAVGDGLAVTVYKR